MLRIDFAPADLAGLRFAHSPLVETVTSAFAIQNPKRLWVYSSWRARATPRLRGIATFLAVVGAPTGAVPDFLTPVPLVPRPTLDDELRVVASTPLDRVAREVDAAWAGFDAPPEITRFAVDPAAALTALVTETRHYFTTAVAPIWPTLRATVESELARRARTAADHGPHTLVADLHPTLSWDGTALTVEHPTKHRHWGLAGHHLTLLPTAFAGPHLHYMTEAPTGRALWYPPRGYGALWDRPPPPAAVTALLGATRAAVLTLLTAPHSTSEVATALTLSPATASHHLTTLRAAGLASTHRVGRRLHYQRTPLGDQLAEAPEA